MKAVFSFGLIFLAAVSVAAGGRTERAVTLRYAFWGSQEEITATTSFLDSYKVTNPGITIEALDLGSGASFDEKIAMLGAGNSLPDLGYLPVPEVLTWAANGKLVDLTDFYKAQPPKLDSLTFVTPDGKTVGVSVANDVQVTWYSRTMFDAAGLSYPPAKASKAWTWDTFVQVAKKLTRDAKGNTPDDPGFDYGNIKSFGAQVQHGWVSWITLAVSNGGGFVSQDGSKLLLDDPATIEAIQKMADLANVDHVSPVTSAVAPFNSPVAMVIDGTGEGPRDLDYAVGVLPYMKNLATSSVGTPVVVYKSSKHLPEALALLKYVMNPQNALPLLKSGLWLPNESQWYSDPKLQSQWTDNAAGIDFVLRFSHRLPPYFLPTFSKIDALVEAALDQVWRGQRTADDVIRNEIMPRVRPIFNGT
jgi:multiple sugar transport system substrate-binding protein